MKAALETAGFKSEDGDVTIWRAKRNRIERRRSGKMQKLIDALEDLDDVQEVYLGGGEFRLSFF